MSLIAMINMIGEYRDTRTLWMSMTSEQKHLAVEGLTGQEDHRTLLRRLRRVTNKARHDAAETRRRELNRRLQEIQIARPVDTVLADIRVDILFIANEPDPLIRSRELRKCLRCYDARLAEITAANRARMSQPA